MPACRSIGRRRSPGQGPQQARWVRAQLTTLLTALLALLLTGTARALAQTGSVRAQEMAQCLPGEISTWADGRDRPAASGAVRLVYRHAGAPPGWDEAQVLGAVRCGAPRSPGRLAAYRLR